VTLSFIAAERIVGEVTFSERLIYDIGNLIQRTGNYHLNETFRGAKLPSGQDLEGNFLFIIAKSEKENLDFGVLFNQAESGGYHIVGLWPRDFAEICKTDREIFEFLMYRLVNTPEFFSKVSLYRSPETEQPVTKVKTPSVAIKPPAPAPEVKRPPTPVSEMKPTPAPEMPAAAAEVKSVMKPPDIEVKPAPPTTPVAIKPPEEAKVELPPELLEGRCPKCKAILPEPRLKVIQRGGNTFCPKCLKIIKGIKAPVEIKPAAEVNITQITQKELDEFRGKAEESIKKGDFATAASYYRRAAQKAKLLDQKKTAKELELQAEECSQKLSSTKIQDIMKSADNFFRQKEYENAIKEYKIALELAKKANDSDLLRDINSRVRQCAELIVTDKVEGYIKSGDQLLREEKYTEAKNLYNQALELEKRIGNKDLIATLQQKIDECEATPLHRKLKEASAKAEKQFKVDKFEEAAKFYQEAASYASQLQDRDAQRFFEQKIKECQITPLKREIQEILRIADAKLESKDYSGASELYAKALNSAAPLEDKNFMQQIQAKAKEADLRLKILSAVNNAEKFFEDKNYQTALNLFNEALKLAQSLGDQQILTLLNDRIQETQNLIGPT
ncbi:MAG: hypothetical protein ACTSQQ_04095, partial [Candidatus Helarchaeota archaeon]